MRRKVSYRPIEAEDVRYLYAAYKQGGLASMGEGFAGGNMGADEFKTAFHASVMSGCHAAWVLFAPTRKGSIPVGIVLAEFARSQTSMDVLIAIWLPWASNRNILEAAVYFLDRIRREIPMMIYCLPEHRRLYDICCAHAVIRRVGTSYSAIPGKAAAVFETRATA
jgi:hypothetical protein